MNIKEVNILHQAIEKLGHLTGGTVAYLPNVLRPGEREVDAVIELTFGKRKSLFTVEIKNELRINHLTAVQNLKAGTKRGFLLVCQYIPMPLKA